MMTKAEKQKRLDQKKWKISQICGKDMSGKMEYCFYCTFQGKEYICTQKQNDRETLCSCAIAYEKMVKLNKKF